MAGRARQGSAFQPRSDWPPGAAHRSRRGHNAPRRGGVLKQEQAEAAGTRTPASMLAAGPSIGRLELVDDRGGEGVEADHRIQAVFGQEMQPDQQRAAADARRSCGRTTRRKTCQGPRPSDAAVSSSAGSRRRSCGCDRQIEEREIGQDRHQNAGRTGREGPERTDPGVALDEGRHGQRRDAQPGPERRARQVAALDQPGQGQRQGDRRSEPCQHHQQQGVDQKFADPRPEDQRGAVSQPVWMAIQTMKPSEQQTKRAQTSRQPRPGRHTTSRPTLRERVSCRRPRKMRRLGQRPRMNGVLLRMSAGGSRGPT